MDFELTAAEEDGLAREREPVSLGVPLPRGWAAEPQEIRIKDAAGNPVPAQFAAAERWSDGSLRWVFADFQVTIPARSATSWRVTRDGTAAAPTGTSIVSRDGGAVIVDTGAARFELAPGTAFPFRSVTVEGTEQLSPERTGLQAEDSAGNTWTAATRAVTVESDGPLAAVVRLEGGFEGSGDGTQALRFTARARFAARDGIVRLALTVHNTRRAMHPGGIWELGDAGSILLRDLSLALSRPASGRAMFRTRPGEAWQDAAEAEILQESSGGDNWRCRVHTTRDGSLPFAFRGYRVVADGRTAEGDRALPRVAVRDRGGAVGLAMRHFAENFPKALEAGPGGVTLRLFPRNPSHPHELQGGERKTHGIILAFGDDATGPRVDALLLPLVVAPTPGAFAAAEALPHLLPAARDPHERYARLVGEALGADGFAAKRGRFDELGWRHFGEMPADHESHGFRGEGTFVSHYNNQYDAVLGALHQFARTGDRRWYRIMDELARHVADIDLYHTEEDKPAYNHGLFWPTVHYVEAGKSTHRTYPRGTEGGGPDNEHNYTTGLRLWGLLAADPLGREAALCGARRALAADDGSRTPFRWVVRGPTGLASKTRDFAYHGPGRGAGNTLVALLDAWRMTGEQRWLDACHGILQRTIHPRDDVAGRHLLDVENRWSYTVHLQALGRYLEEMSEADRRDASYAWAFESLLTYARWMAEHECPTLSHRDKLEFPTETWPAQDLRKAEVFAYAAMCAEGAERERFLERARRFRDDSLASLETFPTRTYTRPLVLLSRYGPLVSWLEQHPDAAFPPPRTTPDFGRPRRFVPQKTRAVRRVRDAVALAAVAGAGFALARLLGA